MNCEQAKKMVSGYLDNTLTDYELQMFLEHIGSCSDCYNELEINYIIYVGLESLDDENASYDLSGKMKQSVESSAQYIRNLTRLKVIRYIISTLAFYGLCVAIFLQIHMWFFR